MIHSLIQGVINNDHGSISKAITIIENDESNSKSLLDSLYPASIRTKRIGITGPPGAGKSTITNAIIELIIQNNESVGVIAVDPTSPFTGGSLLGDRVRMNKYPWDDRVYVRSMASNGDLGGIARKTQDVGDILSASGKDYVIYETVGVGQNEHDIAKAADVCIVVLVPESGDEVQMMKAGLIEIADIFVINKSDRDGAKRLSTMLKNILHFFPSNQKLEPPIFNTIGTQKEGIRELFSGIESHIGKMSQEGYLDRKRLERFRQRVGILVREELEKSFWSSEKINLLKSLTKKINQISKVPHSMAKKLLDDSKNGE